MLLRDPFGKALRDGRRGLFGWALAIGGIAAMYTSFFPSISNPSMAAAIRNYPEALKKTFAIQDLSTPQGYLGSYVFGVGEVQHRRDVDVVVWLVVLDLHGEPSMAISSPTYRDRFISSAPRPINSIFG